MEKQRRLRTWLVNTVNSGKVEGLEWINAEKNMFKIPWKHESRNDWQPSHAQIFTEWARFTGKFVEGRDKPDFKMFKTRLRCAFNKAPDIEEIPEMRKYKGMNPYRIYRLLKSDRKYPVSERKAAAAPAKPRAVSETVEALRAKLKAEYQAVAPVPPHVESLKEEVVANEGETRMDHSFDHSSPLKMNQFNNKRQHRGVDNLPSEVPNQHVQTEFQQYQQQKHEEKAQQLQQAQYQHNQQLSPFPQQPSQQQSPDMPKPDIAQPEQKEQSLVLLQSTRYRGALLKNLHNLQKEGILCDLLLKSSGGQVVPVHANVMCASSPFFKQKVDHWEVGHSGDTLGSCMIIEFESIPFDILNSIIQFIYVGEFEVARTALPIVSSAAHEMRLDDLIILCDHVLKALRCNGGLVDDKSGKPFLPKQAPLMGFATGTSKPQPSKPFPTHVDRINSTPTVNGVNQQGRGLSLPASTMQPMSTTSQDDWHIPVGKGRLASSSNGHIQNPLDVLCQAVDETIRTESQSDSDHERSALVIDESSTHNWNHTDAAINENESVYSPPALTIQMPSLRFPSSVLPMTIQLPPVPLLSLPPVKQLPVKHVDTPMVIDMSSTALNATTPLSPVSTAPVSDNTMYVPLPDAVTTIPQISSAITEVTHITPPASLSKSSNVMNVTAPEGVVPNTKKDGEKFQCNVCNKVLAGKGSLQSHMNKHTVLIQEEVHNNKRPPSADKTDARASDDVIQNIIKRIKTQVPETEQTSNRGAARSTRSRSEAGTESSPILIIPDTNRPARSDSRTSSLERPSGLSRQTSANHQLSTSLPADVGSVLDVAISPPQTADDVMTVTLPNAAAVGAHCCDGCKARFMDTGSLSKHEKKCPNLVYKHMCDECGKPFKSSTALDNHLAWHRSTKALTCKECQKVCKNTLLLKLHVEMHASGKFRFRCSSCAKSFLTKKKLEKHVKDHITNQKHSQKSSVKLNCQFCKEEFQEQEVYVNHLKSHGGAESMNACEQGLMLLHPDTIAEKAYFNSAAVAPLSTGSILERLNTPPLQMERDNSSPDVQIIEDPKVATQRCLICNETYEAANKMLHLLKHFQPHTDPNKLICQICLRAVDKWNLEQHEAVHAADKRPDPLTCPICSVEFENDDELNTHFNEEHADEQTHGDVTMTNQSAPATPMTSEEENKCNQCVEVFTNQEDLQQHLFTHYTTKGKGPLVCPVCNKMFTTKYATYEFKRHMCSHTGEKPIPCRFCDKKFKDYSGRSQHEKRVHNRGPLARGRRKGYKMDRDQLYTPPQPQNYFDDDSEQQTVNTRTFTIGNADVDSGDKAPPPLLSLSTLSEQMKRNIVRGGMEEDSTDSSEDMSLITAVKGARQQHSSATAMERGIKPPPLYQHHLPINVVRPALITDTSPPVLHPQLSSNAAGHAAQSSYLRHAYPNPQVRPPLELLNQLAASSNIAAHKQSVMQEPAPRVMVAQLSDSGIPHVSMDLAPMLLNGTQLSPQAPRMVAMPPGMPQMLQRPFATLDRPPLLIPNPPQLIGQPLVFPGRLPFTSASQPPPLRMTGPHQVGNADLQMAATHFSYMAHQRGYLDAKTLLEKHEAALNAMGHQPTSVAAPVSLR